MFTVKVMVPLRGEEPLSVASIVSVSVDGIVVKLPVIFNVAVGAV